MTTEEVQEEAELLAVLLGHIDDKGNPDEEVVHLIAQELQDFLKVRPLAKVIPFPSSPSN